jgi:hypothetical protein
MPKKNLRLDWYDAGILITAGCSLHVAPSLNLQILPNTCNYIPLPNLLCSKNMQSRRRELKPHNPSHRR